MTEHYSERYSALWVIIPVRFFICLLIFSSLISNLSTKASNVISPGEYSSSSKLASGTWFKLAIPAQGIYKVSYEDMQSMQFPVSGLHSSDIHLHGYAGMLPENAGAKRYDDLPEVAVMMYDGGDGIFNSGDYFCFYSPGPDNWRYNQQAEAYEYNANIYSDQSFYFLTIDGSQGKRLLQAPNPPAASQSVQTYNYRDVINPELVNLIKSGKGWYGDFFDIITEREYTFKPFIPADGAILKTRFSAVARALYGSSFTIEINGVTNQLPISPVSSDFTTNFAFISTNRFSQPAISDLKAKVKYNKLTSMDIGWLNFIEVNTVALLKYQGSPFAFRNNSVNGNAEYQLTGASAQLMVWDVTNQIQPAFVSGNLSNATFSFRAIADTIREYFAFEPSGILKPTLAGAVSNQNLHAMGTPAMLIISPDQFINEAIRLATFHSNHDDLSVSVVTPQAIYNEFSSGSQDVSAIRDFIKMLWHKAEPSSLPRYVLMFGDASYDYKNRVDSNTNLVPTWQSAESLHPVQSLATDDFFVSINDNEGGNPSDVVDIGMGRLPVRTVEEAAMAVDKIIHYVTDTQKVNGDWRNIITFVADDEDGNIHMSQADQLGQMIDTVYPNYNVDKIYLDAYVQERTVGGQRSPDANTAINQRIAKGSLIVNYTGHGGETSWTHEEILKVPDILGWTNYDKLPVFMTATCEFSRYDDPERVSGGEHAFLNRHGGAIALFTTSRPTYGTPNFSLARNFYDIALKPMNGSMPQLGDIIRVAKNLTQPDNNNKKFILLGDPAMKMAYPALRVITSSITDVSSGNQSDTLGALQIVNIEGFVANNDNSLVSDFNGIVVPTVFDKQSNIVTFGSDGNAPMSFSLWRNIIYKGRAEVKNGRFSFSFIVPRDIAYNFGKGKISYYASDGTTDASGNYSSIIVGGFADVDINDTDGPEVSLFINDSSFKEGGFTDENPVLLAYVSDSCGINTLGNSIGHDIVAYLDDNTQDPWVLNEYYESDLNTFKKGSIRFPMFNLEPGVHTLTLKLWDVNNNSSEVKTRFIVAPKNEIILSDIEAWPNPMHDMINFAIQHNQAGKELSAQLTLYNLSGIKVASFEKISTPEGFRSNFFTWDGRNSNGKPVAAGFYIANLRITTPEGYTADKSVKIIIAR
ncbi:MAG TPA: type IX secretion system sortase PorU [Lentimicrobium sp.]|nr:type IX secretion system sortase PorU [Lentimicrobium sp.]